MKLSWRWLGEMVDLSSLTAEQGAERLTFQTAEVEEVVPYGGGLEGVVVGRVLGVRPHPQADRLRLCIVDAGDGTPPREVVCGAPNVAEGQAICYAREGVTLPNGLTLTKRKIRGVESAGMICAEDELGLGTDHDGILVLPKSMPAGLPVGRALNLPDAVLGVSNTAITHRPDLWGHVGFARELAASFGTPLKLPETKAADAALGAATGPAFPVEVRDPAGCRRYVALVVEGVVNGPSPDWMRRRLQALGLRSVDLVVDLTNLVMLEQGQPLHAFDLRDLSEGRIVVRGAQAGETLVTLEGTTRSLAAGDLLICSGDRPVALAGVLGGKDSGVRADTTTVLLEAATFDPARVRRTASRLGIRTEASSRFEKALDPLQAEVAARRFLELLLAASPGARVTRRLADVYPSPYPSVAVDLPHELVRKRLGARISDMETKAALTALGFRLTTEDHRRLVVEVPSWRATKDVSVAEDLVEEVGRMRRYEGIDAVAPLRPMAPVEPPPARRLERRVGALLSLDLGCVETKSHAFYGAKEAERLGLAGVEHLRLVHPLSEEEDRLAMTSAAALLSIAARNQPREAAARVWQSTRLFVPAAAKGRLPTEVPVAGVCVWDAGDADQPAGRLVRGLFADVGSLLARAGAGDVVVRDHAGEPLAPGLPPATWLHPGRRALWTSGGAPLAVAGEIAPSVCRAFGIAGRAAWAEVSMDALLAATAKAPAEYRPVPRFPASTFDVAVVVPRKTPGAEVARAIEAAAPGRVRDVVAFDVYEGAGIPEGSRSLAFTCSLLGEDATLTPAQADALRMQVRRALESRGWTVRAGDDTRKS